MNSPFLVVQSRMFVSLPLHQTELKATERFAATFPNSSVGWWRLYIYPPRAFAGKSWRPQECGGAEKVFYPLQPSLVSLVITSKIVRALLQV